MIPDALVQCTVDLPSGLTVRPFADDPHITQEGFILHGSSAEIRAKVYRFLLQREISSNVAPSVREHLEWHPENGNQIQIFPFRSLAHLTLQAFPPPAKRRVSRKPAQWIFFPRVRTPCGHGAQVIMEGKEIQSDGGEKDKDNPTTKNNRQPQPKGRVSTIL